MRIQPKTILLVIAAAVVFAFVFWQVFYSGSGAPAYAPLPAYVPEGDNPPAVQNPPPILIPSQVSSSPAVGAFEAQPIPRGPQTYNVSEAAGRLPHIVQVTVDSPDVALGGTQKFSITIEDDTNISSVVVRTTLNDSEVETPLALLLPVGPSPTAEAPSGMPTFEYGGSWTVTGAHDTKYSTKFIVTDSQGRVNTVRLLWRGI